MKTQAERVSDESLMKIVAEITTRHAPAGMERFEGNGFAMVGEVFYRGPRGVAVWSAKPEPESQYPDNRAGMISVYLFDATGRVLPCHSHGYSPSYLNYFKTLLG